MKKINYRNAIDRGFRGLIVAPEKFAKRLGITLITGRYPGNVSRDQMADALAVWMAVNPESAFYSALEERLWESGMFITAEYHAARDAYATKLLMRVSSGMNELNNVHIRNVCMFMSLPQEVARKWLWHENVDFQSCESFLRRLTREQCQSLKIHYQLVQKGADVKKLPCFTDGASNKMWRIFNPTSQEHDRMVTKSALAHDFFGMGMGFQLYPDAVKDHKTDKGLTSQFMSTEDRGTFEVNKENGGWYWLLFRKLRSNSLYCEGKQVELGRWVCPGFWFTMIVWAVLAIASPASLAFASWLQLRGVTSIAFFSVGAILPVVLALLWARKVTRKVYSADYWKGVGFMCVGFAAALTLYNAAMFVHDLFVFPVLVVSLLFLVPFCFTKETGKFWQAPILGKVLTLALLVALAFDLYSRTDFFEFCGAFFVALAHLLRDIYYTIAAFLYRMRYAIMWFSLFILGYAALVAGLFRISAWVARKIDLMIEQGNTYAYVYERATNLGVSILLVMTLLLVGGTAYTGSAGVAVSGWQFFLLVALIAVPFLLVLAAGMSTRSVEYKVLDKVFNEGWVAYVPLERQDTIRKEIASNDFWVDITNVATRSRVLKEVLIQTSHDPGYRFMWVLQVIRSVKSDQELNNAARFIERSHLYYQLPVEINPELLKLVLAGEREEVIRRMIDLVTEEQIQAAKAKKPSLRVILADCLMGLVEKCGSGVMVFLRALWWPVRALWRGLCDIYRLWKVFNERCPQSPSSNRPLAH